MTGVRAVGAAVVFFDHFPLVPDVHVAINVMAFFFALSGFLIFRIYYERVLLTRHWLKQYFANRFARIYPVYFLILSISVCVGHDFRPWVLFANYTLIGALFRGTQVIIPPSWTLTVEECFYLLAPLFMILAAKGGFRAAFGLACALGAAALAVSRTGVKFLQTPVFVLSTTFFGHFVEFFAGAYIALVLIKLEKTQSVRREGRAYTAAGLAGVMLIVVLMMAIYRREPLNYRAIIILNNFVIPVPIALLYWGLIRENTGIARLLSTRALALLGRASYSFYLLHTLMIDYVSIPYLLPAIGQRATSVMVTFVMTWILSIILFVVYEEPLNLLLRKKLGAA